MTKQKKPDPVPPPKLLLPCPICGGEAGDDFVNRQVSCKKCGTRGPEAEMPWSRARLWNSRPPSRSLDQLFFGKRD